jgi:hypothetical protein
MKMAVMKQEREKNNEQGKRARKEPQMAEGKGARMRTREKRG